MRSACASASTSSPTRRWQLSPTIPARAMMRELQNVIEWVIILLPGPTLRLVLDELQPNRPGPGSRARLRTLEEVEREHILQVRRNTDWMMADRTVPPHFGVKPTPDSSARRNLTFLCGRSDRMLTAVEHFRHRPTAHRCLMGTADPPSCMAPLDPSSYFRLGAGVPSDWNANCPGVQPAMYRWHQPCPDTG
jgi:hypothetical protein